MIRTMIVDDERLARQALRVRLEREPDVEIVGEAVDGDNAVQAIRQHRPDLVYLDVQMPGLNGFEVLEMVSDDHLPMVVFVTAHDAHVLKAFEVHALDYLLKPYSESRFKESLRRARQELERDSAFPERIKLGSLLDELHRRRQGEPEPPDYPRRFAVRENDRIVLIPISEVDAVEAAGNYVMVVAGKRKHILRQTLAEIERQLDPSLFVRIHRSTIVNVDRVREVRLDSHGDCDVTMDTGVSYRLSRAHREHLLSNYGGAVRPRLFNR